MNKIKATAGIGTFTLMMLMTGSIDSIRNLPATALFGPSLIFFAIGAALLFLIPIALVSAELSSLWKDNGGVFHWVKMAFGEKTALFAIWLQWVNTLVWYPTILSFIAGTAAYLINPQLAHNKWYLISVILSVFWILTLVNLKGVETSARFASFCALVGMVFPMIFIISLAAIWMLNGQPLSIAINTHSIIPDMSHSQNWISLTAIVTSYLGIELATVHIKDVKSAQHTFPKAMFFSTLFIIATMVIGSLAIAVVVPSANIHLVDGIMQAFNHFFSAYHLEWFTPILVGMLVLGSVGGMINWIISPAKGLLQAGELGYLPKLFCKQNQHGVASNLLITQAILVTFICLAFLFMPSVNGSYWLLTDLSTQLYVLMYVVMFLAAISIAYKFAHKTKTFNIPGGKHGTVLVCLIGLVGCMITLAVGFIPPQTINVGSATHYEVVFISSMIVMLIPAFLMMLKKPKPAAAELDAVSAC